MLVQVTFEREVEKKISQEALVNLEAVDVAAGLAEAERMIADDECEYLDWEQVANPGEDEDKGGKVEIDSVEINDDPDATATEL